MGIWAENVQSLSKTGPLHLRPPTCIMSASAALKRMGCGYVMAYVYRPHWYAAFWSKIFLFRATSEVASHNLGAKGYQYPLKLPYCSGSRLRRRNADSKRLEMFLVDLLLKKVIQGEMIDMMRT